MRHGLIHYPQDEIFREIAFLAYYFHWSYDTLMNMTHAERQRWCKEVSKINKEIGSDQKTTSILDIK